MKKDVAEKWVAALRSDDYTQAKFALAPLGEGHCCLGVLCELAAKAVDKIVVRAEGGYSTTYDGLSISIPKSVVAWAGLSCDDPFVPFETDEGPKAHLSWLNDSAGLNFQQIASLIEANWEKL